MTEEQFKRLYDNGLISSEDMNKLCEEIHNEKSELEPIQKTESVEIGLNKWMIVGAFVLVAIIITLAIVNSKKSNNDTNIDSTVSDIQPEELEPVYQEPEWTPSCGEWIMDDHSALLRLSYNRQPIFVRYYPGDRFELSAPDMGMNDWCFKIMDSNGKTVKMATSTEHHIQGSERVEIDDPVSVKKLYRLLEQGNFVIQPAWLIEVNVGDEGCGLADFVWHKFTKHDPYTNEILGKSDSDCSTMSSPRVYDSDPKNGLGSNEALELIIRSELGDEDASSRLEDAMGKELQQLLGQ